MSKTQALGAIAAGLGFIAFAVVYLYVREVVAKRPNRLGRLFDSDAARSWDRIGSSIVILIGVAGIVRGVLAL